MSDSWDAAAEEWDTDVAVRAYAAAAMGSLEQVLDDCGLALENAVVCDFGCGTGLLTEQLVSSVASIDAIDTSQAMLDVLERKAVDHGWSDVTTATEIPASSGPHDLVVCSSVCSFLDDYPGTVTRLAGLLRPGGVFVQWDWERVPGGDHGLTRDEIAQTLASAGLVRCKVETAFTVDVHGDQMAPLVGVGQRPSGE